MLIVSCITVGQFVLYCQLYYCWTFCAVLSFVLLLDNLCCAVLSVVLLLDGLYRIVSCITVGQFVPYCQLYYCWTACAVLSVVLLFDSLCFIVSCISVGQFGPYCQFITVGQFVPY